MEAAVPDLFLGPQAGLIGPVTEQDRLRFHEGQEWFRQRGGKGIPMEEVLAEFGLKPENFPRRPDDTP